MVQLVHLLQSTVPPPVTTHDAGAQEALAHEPWLIVTTIIVGSLAGILSGIAAIMAARRAKVARDHSVVAAATVKTQFEETIGTPNGHGNVMDQLAHLADNQMRDSTLLNEYQMHADRKLERIDAKLDGHVSESVIYRQGVNNTLGALADRLRAHDEWERANKYRLDHDQPPLPWDGVDRRQKDQPPHTSKERRSPKPKEGT